MFSLHLIRRLLQFFEGWLVSLRMEHLDEQYSNARSFYSCAFICFLRHRFSRACGRFLFFVCARASSTCVSKSKIDRDTRGRTVRIERAVACTRIRHERGKIQVAQWKGRTFFFFFLFVSSSFV